MKSAKVGLFVLTLINLFNYLDRYIVSALVEPLKNSELHLSHAQSGLLMTGFVVVYMLTSPFFGTLGDRYSRPKLIGAGVIIWSIATALGGLAAGFLSLFAARALVGIGEAAYGTIAPALIADYFPLAQRGRMFSIFFCAIPIGSALGFVIGGLVNEAYGWRATFFVAGLPGLFLALLALKLFDPPRGAQDGVRKSTHSHDSSGWRAYWELLQNRPYRLTILGYAAYTFALGGLAFWMPSFLETVRGVPAKAASVNSGAVVVVTGFAGTFLGGWLGDYFLKYSKQAYLWVSAITAGLAAPFAALALMHPDPHFYWTGMFLAELLLFASTGPINSMVVNLVDPLKRATAVAMCNFSIHVLGDVPSPPLIGWISDHSSLEQAVLLVPVAIVITAGIWTQAARVTPGEVHAKCA